MTSKKSARAAIKSAPLSPLQEQVQHALSCLESKSTKHDLENLKKFGIHTAKALAVSMANLKLIARELGRNHQLAAALWDTGWYESRMLACLVDEPNQVSSEQMDRWCLDFDNWGICDTACFCLFDRTPHAFDKVEQWRDGPGEFVKRAAFSLLACLALHDRLTGDKLFLAGLRQVKRAADDERNFVKKGVSWALRAIGRRNQSLYAAAVVVAHRLAASEEAAARWVGKDALREFNKPAVIRGLAAGEARIAEPRSQLKQRGQVKKLKSRPGENKPSA